MMRQIMLILGMLFACYIGYALVDMTSRFFSFQTVLDAWIFTSIIACFLGLWRLKRWALWLSWGLALAAFAWGCYLIHFVWTFWLFSSPTLMERIGNVLNPRVSVFVIFPILWLIYFTQPKTKAFFV